MTVLIKAIQMLLGVTADGVFGKKSIEAAAKKLGCSANVKSIQTAIGVKADGILGAKSYAALAEKLGVKTTTTAATTSTVDPLLKKYIEKPVVISKVDYVVKNLPKQKEVRSDKSVFGKHGVESNLVAVKVPAGYPMKYGSTPVTQIRCHKLVADRLEAALKDILNHYGSDLAKVAPGACIYDGCYNNRTTASGGSRSIHSWGIAIDFDAGNNMLKTKAPKARLSQDIYKPFLQILEAHGFLSLGKRNNYDWMHVQCCKWDS